MKDKKKIITLAISFLAGAIVATSGFCIYTAVRKKDCCPKKDCASYSQRIDEGKGQNGNDRMTPPDMQNGQNNRGNQNGQPPQMPNNGQQNSGDNSGLPELPSGSQNSQNGQSSQNSQNGQSSQPPQIPGNNS